MGDDPRLRDLVLGATRLQERFLKGLAIASVLSGVGIGVLMAVMPAKPGDANALRVLLGMAVAMFAGGVVLWRWTHRKISRIRHVFLERPDLITDAKLVTIPVNGTPHYAVHVRDARGETLGIRVPNAATGHEVVARLRQEATGP